MVDYSLTSARAARKSCIALALTVELYSALYMDEGKLNLRPGSPVADMGRILALDLGTVKIGVAVCDEQRLTIRRLLTLPRTSWKRFVEKIKQLCRDFDVQVVVVGLPLNMDGTSGDAAQSARRAARNLHLSLGLPIYLQDERLTSAAAIGELRDEGLKHAEIEQEIHSHSAAIILRDFLLSLETDRVSVSPSDEGLS